MEAKQKEREQARELRMQGMSLNQIRKRLGVSKGSVSLWVRDIEITQPEKPIKVREEREVIRIDWDAVQEYYNIVKSLRKCCTHFNISKWSIDKAVADGLIVCHLKVLHIKEVLVRNSTLSTGNVRKRLLSSGIKAKCCEECGITEWNGKAITFELHHVNGVNNDHRLENLQLLCPNCHSQTETYKGKNKNAANKRKLVVTPMVASCLENSGA